MAETKATLDTAEATLDAIEMQLDTIEKISGIRSFFGKTSTKILGTGILGIAIGAAGSYFILKTRLETKYAEISEIEIADAKRYYSALNKADEFSSPESAVAALIPEEEQLKSSKQTAESIIARGDYRPSDSKHDPDVVVEETIVQEESIALSEEIDTEPQTISQNIWAKSAPTKQDDFDYDEEVSKRTEEAPYIITHDEFYENENDYEVSSLTYYDGDGVLVDGMDQQVDTVEQVVGHDNLLKFGYGSKDENVVYIRNDRMLLNIEVVRSSGKYTEEVLGFIKHSNDHRPMRKFRRDDE